MVRKCRVKLQQCDELVRCKASAKNSATKYTVNMMRACSVILEKCDYFLVRKGKAILGKKIVRNAATRVNSAEVCYVILERCDKLLTRKSGCKVARIEELDLLIFPESPSLAENVSHKMVAKNHCDDNRCMQSQSQSIVDSNAFICNTCGTSFRTKRGLKIHNYFCLASLTRGKQPEECKKKVLGSTSASNVVQRKTAAVLQTSKLRQNVRDRCANEDSFGILFPDDSVVVGNKNLTNTKTPYRGSANCKQKCKHRCSKVARKFLKCYKCYKVGSSMNIHTKVRCTRVGLSKNRYNDYCWLGLSNKTAKSKGKLELKQRPYVASSTRSEMGKVNPSVFTDPSDKSRLHVCGDCGKLFYTKSKLQVHSLIHYRKTPYQRYVKNQAVMAKACNVIPSSNTSAQKGDCGKSRDTFSKPLARRHTEILSRDNSLMKPGSSNSEALEMWRQQLQENLQLNSQFQAFIPKQEFPKSSDPIPDNSKPDLQPRVCGECDKVFYCESKLDMHLLLHLKSRSSSKGSL